MSKKEYPAKLTTGYYRVREVWEDEASQFGAYRLLANAKAKRRLSRPKRRLTRVPSAGECKSQVR